MSTRRLPPAYGGTEIEKIGEFPFNTLVKKADALYYIPWRIT